MTINNLKSIDLKFYIFGIIISHLIISFFIYFNLNLNDINLLLSQIKVIDVAINSYIYIGSIILAKYIANKYDITTVNFIIFIIIIQLIKNIFIIYISKYINKINIINNKIINNIINKNITKNIGYKMLLLDVTNILLAVFITNLIYKSK